MSEQKVIRTIKVTNPAGLHTRSATDIANVVRKSRSRVVFSKDHNHADGTDVLAIIALYAPCGTQVKVEAAGPDALDVLQALEPLFGDYEGKQKQKHKKPRK